VTAPSADHFAKVFPRLNSSPLRAKLPADVSGDRIMIRPIPIGIDDFRVLREKNHEYVDKTNLITHLIDRENIKVVLLPRPRRFGKTLNMSTLKWFFEKRDENVWHFFEALHVARAGVETIQQMAVAFDGKRVMVLPKGATPPKKRGTVGKKVVASIRKTAKNVATKMKSSKATKR